MIWTRTPLSAKFEVRIFTGESLKIRPKWELLIDILKVSNRNRFEERQNHYGTKEELRLQN